jgi:IS30 family transposase
LTDIKESVRQGLRLRVERLHAAGVPSSVIARRLGMTRSEVNHIVKAYMARRRGRA